MQVIRLIFRIESEYVLGGTAVFEEVPLKVRMGLNALRKLVALVIIGLALIVLKGYLIEVEFAPVFFWLTLLGLSLWASFGVLSLTKIDPAAAEIKRFLMGQSFGKTERLQHIKAVVAYKLSGYLCLVMACQGLLLSYYQDNPLFILPTVVSVMSSCYHLSYQVRAYYMGARLTRLPWIIAFGIWMILAIIGVDRLILSIADDIKWSDYGQEVILGLSCLLAYQVLTCLVANKKRQQSAKSRTWWSSYFEEQFIGMGTAYFLVIVLVRHLAISQLSKGLVLVLATSILAMPTLINLRIMRYHKLIGRQALFCRRYSLYTAIVPLVILIGMLSLVRLSLTTSAMAIGSLLVVMGIRMLIAEGLVASGSTDGQKTDYFALGHCFLCLLVLGGVYWFR